MEKRRDEAHAEMAKDCGEVELFSCFLEISKKT